MSHFTDDQLPSELAETARQLRSERPEPTGDVLDRAYRRVRSKRARPSRSPTVLVAACLGLGILFSGAGTTLAVSGLSAPGTATERQYGTYTSTTPTDPVKTPVQSVAGEQQGSTPTLGGGVKDERAAGGKVLPYASVSPARQLEATTRSGQLPFTGYAAIPVMLIGIALLVMGATLRRRTRRTDSL
jgi:hypothetical protein